MNKSIVSNKGKKRSGIRTTKGSDTTSVKSVKMLVFGYCFQIRVGIAVQYEIGIGNGVIVDEVVQF